MTQAARQQSPLETPSCAVPERHPAPICCTSGLAAILLQRPDIPAAVRWLTDFGLTAPTVAADYALLRGATGRTPCVVLTRGKARYLGFSLFIDSMEDLQRLAQATGKQIEEGGPGRGGHRVVLTDPDGLIVEAVHGFVPLLPQPLPAGTASNHAAGHPRINEAVRPKRHGPPPVCTLGHTVIGVRRFLVTAEWYQHLFGFIVSDFQMLPGDTTPAVAFMRCNRGATPSDHHTLALTSGLDVGHLHTAFELDNLDDIGRAHALLEAKRYRASWGIGRHRLGSQIFDYWRDPWGDLFEHYADGDVFDSSVSTGYHPFAPGSLHQWGPAPSADSNGKIPTLHRLKTLVSRLYNRSDDLSVARALRLLNGSD